MICLIGLSSCHSHVMGIYLFFDHKLLSFLLKKIVPWPPKWWPFPEHQLQQKQVLFRLFFFLKKKTNFFVEQLDQVLTFSRPKFFVMTLFYMIWFWIIFLKKFRMTFTFINRWMCFIFFHSLYNLTFSCIYFSFYLFDGLSNRAIGAISFQKIEWVSFNSFIFSLAILAAGPTSIYRKKKPEDPKWSLSKKNWLFPCILLKDLE